MPAIIQERLVRVLGKLQQDPSAVSAKKLVSEESYRIRVGDYRIVYDLDTVEQVITVLKVAHRKDVYRRWESFVATCQTCHLTAIRQQQPLCERIFETEHWRVAHAFNTSLPGWLVVIAKRHVESFAELSDAEALEFGPFLHRVSRALQQATGANKTYTILFAEHPEHLHVHFHVVPRAADMPADKRSLRVYDYLGVPEAQVVPLATRNALAQTLRTLLDPT